HRPASAAFPAWSMARRLKHRRLPPLQASMGKRLQARLLRQLRVAPRLLRWATPAISQTPEMAPIFARENQPRGLPSALSPRYSLARQNAGSRGKPDMLNKVSSNVSGEASMSAKNGSIQLIT